MASAADRLALPLTLVLALATATPAHAHKLKVFATAEGATIEGRVYFVGGGGAPGAAIAVEAPPGTPIAVLATDGDGRFRFQASSRTDHLFIADTGDGHSARFAVVATDLAASLPTPTAAATSASSHALHGRAGDRGAGASSELAGTPTLRDIVADAVASQVRPLRQQLNDYEDQVRFRDVVGGIGYIFGLAGVALWLRAVRRPRGGR